MSGGPIKSERDAWIPAVVSTPDARRVCKRSGVFGYCGRVPKQATTEWAETTCADCRAAARADGLEIS